MISDELLNILNIIVIPISLALLSIVWPIAQSWHRRRIFRKLVYRELEELGPHPKEPVLSGWVEHCSNGFIHYEILQDVSAHRDFILSLDPTEVYLLTQLWAGVDNSNWDQFEYALRKLEPYQGGRFLFRRKRTSQHTDNQNGKSSLLSQWKFLHDRYELFLSNGTPT